MKNEINENEALNKTHVITSALISMTDFVIQEWEKDNYTDVFAKIVKNYADFLKQPLKLEMFICEVPEPEIQGGYSPDGDFVGGYCEKWIEEYQLAKEKVLFKDFEMCDRSERKDCVFSNDEHIPIKWLEASKVEDLIKYNLNLTDSAIERIFGKH